MYCEKQTTMDKNEQTKACSARACRTSDGRKNTQEPISSPNDRFLSGGEIGPGTQLYVSGKLREEYTKRSAAIPENLSKAEQRKMRADIKNDTRMRQNSFAKALINDIDSRRKAIEEEAIKRGEPSPFRKDHAQSTNNDVNEYGKLCKKMGRGLIAAGFASEAYNIIQAPKGQRVKEVTRAAGRLGGGYLGGRLGAYAGASGGNIGTVVAGSLIGGVVGSMAGEKGVDVMWDTFGK